MKGEISAALEDAVKLRRQLIDDGTPATEADHIVGQGLKAVLGAQRADPWRFYCEHCRDTGWINVTPSAEAQARLRKLYGASDQHAGYLVKCEPCKWNDMQRAERRKKSGDAFGEDDLLAAGQMNKSKGFKRLT